MAVMWDMASGLEEVGMVMRDLPAKIAPSSSVRAQAARLDRAWRQRYRRMDRASAASRSSSSWGQRVRWYWRSAWGNWVGARATATRPGAGPVGGGGAGSQARLAVKLLPMGLTISGCDASRLRQAAAVAGVMS
jgi:hypothetical protein